MKALLMEQTDNVAVVLQKLKAGEKTDIILDRDITDSVETKTEIPFGHKIAVKNIDIGDSIYKYGEVIGRSTQAIQRGEHVHIHNAISIRGSANLA